MTTTHARTANEQLIAVLEARLVTTRGALQRIANTTTGPCQFDANQALATSTDYANKIVVNREEWEAISGVAEAAKYLWSGPGFSTTNDGARAAHQMGDYLARLDSIRKGGGK